MSTKLRVAASPPFDFERTVRSHGWVALAPNSWDAEHGLLRRTERLSSGKVVLLTLGSTGSDLAPAVEVTVHHAGDLLPRELQEIRSAVAWMLRTDEDFSAFYALCVQRGGRWRRLTSGQGRLLRSPTLFEDVVRTILTTNIQWRGTMRMVRGLVDALGEPFPGDDAMKAFPTPQAVAALPMETFAQAVSLGYRGPYIHALSCQVATGSLDVEALRHASLPTSGLRKRLLAIKGVGSYAAATLLMILGRYDDLAVDTEFRQFVSEKYFAGQQVSDAEAKAIYDDWGAWKYLAYWFDIVGG